MMVCRYVPPRAHLTRWTTAVAHASLELGSERQATGLFRYLDVDGGRSTGERAEGFCAPRRYTRPPCRLRFPTLLCKHNRSGCLRTRSPASRRGYGRERNQFLRRRRYSAGQGGRLPVKAPFHTRNLGLFAGPPWRRERIHFRVSRVLLLELADESRTDR
jgi:hypothetical protein